MRVSRGSFLCGGCVPEGLGSEAIGLRMLVIPPVRPFDWVMDMRRRECVCSDRGSALPARPEERSVRLGPGRCREISPVTKARRASADGLGVRQYVHCGCAVRSGRLDWRPATTGPLPHHGPQTMCCVDSGVQNHAWVASISFWGRSRIPASVLSASRRSPSWRSAALRVSSGSVNCPLARKVVRAMGGSCTPRLQLSDQQSDVFPATQRTHSSVCLTRRSLRTPSLPQVTSIPRSRRGSWCRLHTWRRGYSCRPRADRATADMSRFPSRA